MNAFLKSLTLTFAVVFLSAAAASADATVCSDQSPDHIPEGTEIKFLKRFDFDKNSSVSIFTAGDFECRIALNDSNRNPRFIRAGRTSKINQPSYSDTQNQVFQFNFDDTEANIAQIHCEGHSKLLNVEVVLKTLKEHIQFISISPIDCDVPVEASVINDLGNNAAVPASSVR